MDHFNGKEIGVFNLIYGRQNLKDKLIFKTIMMVLFGLQMKNLSNTFQKFKFANITVAIIFQTPHHS